MTTRLLKTTGQPVKRRRIRWWIVLIVAALVVAGVAAVVWWPHGPTNPVAGRALYVAPASQAASSAAELKAAGRTADAEAMAHLASQPAAEWFNGGSVESTEQRARQLAEAAAERHEVPVVVAYNLPHRDCNGASAGGDTYDAYRQWILALARGLDVGSLTQAGSDELRYPDYRAIVIYEPDSVAHVVGATACIRGQEAERRLALEAESIGRLKQVAGVHVYLDAANSGWFADPSVMVEPLRQAGAEQADGLAVNVSNFQTTEASVTYGRKLADQLGGLHLVVDTSRNGAGPYTSSKSSETDPTWCNPPGRTSGRMPTTSTGLDDVDAYLWIKRLGESDGACRTGEPPAGQWMERYALNTLAQG